MGNENKDPATRLRLLAQYFPSMWSAPGIRPWDANVLDEWAAGGASHGEKCTARFLLAVWNPSEAWRSGRFDLMDALGAWDLEHRRAFLEWAQNPWWA